MFDSLPRDARDTLDWDWSRYEPYFKDLEARPVNEGAVHQWLTDWSALADLLEERDQRLYLATSLNTQDEQAEQAYTRFQDEIASPAREVYNRLNKIFLASGLEPKGMKVTLRGVRADADLFREENVPLLADHDKTAIEYDKIVGVQTVTWDGQELTTAQLANVVKDADRATRERAWMLSSQRVLADRDAINAVWVKLLGIRRRLAENAGKKDYRDYRWQQWHRFDYSPGDCETFQRAIEEVVVPAARRVYERRRALMGLDALRPWDVCVDYMRSGTDLTGDPRGLPPIKPFKDVDELEAIGAGVFQRVDPTLGGYFETMRREKLFDLPNYKGKGPGAYCTSFAAVKRPFVLMNATSKTDDVNTFLHEFGHAFHDFEMFPLPYFQQRTLEGFPFEMAEVASMGMELLAVPYLTRDQGGFYSEQEAARALIEKLESMLMFWPFMAVMDAFQHWVYTHIDEAIDPDSCDRQWSGLWDRFIVGVDWSGLDAQKAHGWHRKVHLYHYPFYYVDYGLAQLGALQVWRNALTDQAGAVARYRKALALGSTATLPDLYAAAGAKFAFDSATLKTAVDLIEENIERSVARLS